MKLSERIWEELGALAAMVEIVEHDTGGVRFKESTSQADRDAVAAVIAAHNPLTKATKTPEELVIERQQKALEALPYILAYIAAKADAPVAVKDKAAELVAVKVVK